MERSGLQRLAIVLTIINLVLLGALAAIGLVLYNSVQNTIQTVEDTVQTVEDTVQTVGESVESVSGAVEGLVGGDLPGVDELRAQLDRFGDQQTQSGGSQDADTTDLESRIRALEEQVGSTPSADQPGDEDVMLDIFPELRFDGMLSDECASVLQGEVRRRYSAESSERRYRIESIERWRSYPYSQLSNRMLNGIESWIDEMAYSRGWRDWQEDGYRVYDRSYDESGSGASSPLPCLQEREQVNLFSNIREENPLGRFRENAIRTYWECVERIEEQENRPEPTPTPSFEEDYVEPCRSHAERFAQWLPPLSNLEFEASGRAGGSSGVDS